MGTLGRDAMVDIAIDIDGGFDNNWYHFFVNNRCIIKSWLSVYIGYLQYNFL